MNFTFSILFVVISLSLVGQRNVISIRKIQYDTTFYTESITDTIPSLNSPESVLKFLKNRQQSNGIWNKNIFFDLDSFYIFSHWISPRMKKLALKNPSRFWKKVRRKIQKKKLSVYSSWYYFKEKSTEYRIRTFSKTYCYINDPENKKILFNQKMVIDSTLESSIPYNLTQYIYVSRYDSIALSNTRFNFTRLCPQNQDSDLCIFHSLLGNLEATYRRNHPFGYFRLSNKISRNSYEFYFNFENFLVKKAILVKNNQEKYYYNFEILGDTLFFIDIPIPEFSSGLIARKKNKIRFRYHSKSYIFYLKSPLYVSPNFLSKTRLNHYQLALAE